MTEREIDTAIDRAVRDFMDVDTDPAFRARVTARLQRPAHRALTPRLTVAAVATVALALALLWLRTTPPAPTTQGNVAGAERAISPPPPVAGSNPKARSTVRMGGPQPSARRAPEPSIPRGTVVAALVEMPFTSIAPLTAIEPISVEPIANTPITPPEIVVAPLSAIAEVQISPLEPRTARN